MFTNSASEIQIHPKKLPKHKVQNLMDIFSVLLKLDKYEVQIKHPRTQVEQIILDQVKATSTIITLWLYWSCDTDAGSLLAHG